MKKIIEWMKRYAPAEIFAYMGAFLSGFTTEMIFKSSLMTALSATWGENIFYYGYILVQELYKEIRENRNLTFGTVFDIFKNLIFEFGVAEYLDSCLIRPYFMYLFPIYLNNLGIGILVAKISADLFFYIPTIFFYEIRKRFSRTSS